MIQLYKVKGRINGWIHMKTVWKKMEDMQAVVLLAFNF